MMHSGIFCGLVTFGNEQRVFDFDQQAKSRTPVVFNVSSLPTPCRDTDSGMVYRRQTAGGNTSQVSDVAMLVGFDAPNISAAGSAKRMENCPAMSGGKSTKLTGRWSLLDPGKLNVRWLSGQNNSVRT